MRPARPSTPPGPVRPPDLGSKTGIKPTASPCFAAVQGEGEAGGGSLASGGLLLTAERFLTLFHQRSDQPDAAWRASCMETLLQVAPQDIGQLTYIRRPRSCDQRVYGE